LGIQPIQHDWDLKERWLEQQNCRRNRMLPELSQPGSDTSPVYRAFIFGLVLATTPDYWFEISGLVFAS